MSDKQLLKPDERNTIRELNDLFLGGIKDVNYFNAIENSLQIIKNHFNAGGVGFIRHIRTRDRKSSEAQFYYSKLSPDTTRCFNLEKFKFEHAKCLLGRAVLEQVPVFLSKKEAQIRIASGDPLFDIDDNDSVVRNIKNLTILPVFRRFSFDQVQYREEDIWSNMEFLGYLWISNIKFAGKAPITTSKIQVHREFLIAVCKRLASELVYERGYKRALRNTILAIVEALDRRDPKNAEHSRRVAMHMQEIGKVIFKNYRNKDDWGELSLSEVQQSFYVGVLHDVGKVGFPEDVLRGETEIKEKQRFYRRVHPHASVAIVEHIEGLSSDIVKAIAEHHEQYNGNNGYMYKKQKQDISRLARILAAADTYDSMRRSRSSWRGFSVLAAYAQLLRLKDFKLDPIVVDAFLETEEFSEIRDLLLTLNGNVTPSLVIHIENPKNLFLTEFYGCVILHHEIGPGILGLEDRVKEKNRLQDIHDEIRNLTRNLKSKNKSVNKKEDIQNRLKKYESQLHCQYACNFKIQEVLKRVSDAVKKDRHEDSQKKSGRAQESELAFLHIRWDLNDKGQSIDAVIYDIINRFSFQRNLLPISMQNGIGILALKCNNSEAYELAENLHEIISSKLCSLIDEQRVKNISKGMRKIKKYKQTLDAQAIGISYAPDKDIIGCKCIIGCALIASYYAKFINLKRKSKPIVFFERYQLEAVQDEETKRAESKKLKRSNI